MTRRIVCAFALLGLFVLGCDAPVGPRRDAGPRDAVSAGADSDNDTLSDAVEDLVGGRDSDGDGTPDALDTDSDDDGISDADEAGDAIPSTPPSDTDGDGLPDYRDLDSDDNGIVDTDEPTTDDDGDLRRDAYDLDDDGDGISDDVELGAVIDPPRDDDGDGTPNHRDRDSDGDTIDDTHEREVDTDGDDTADYLDEDTDADGIPDADEAGDADLATTPIDTDMDATADFRDPDSDGDGLSDRDEHATYMTSPTSADSDGDGVGDLVEVAAGTDPISATDSPRSRGDFVFVVPYMEPPDPTRDTLSFRTSIQFADIYFLFDRSGSMAGEIGALRTAVGTVMADLTCLDTGFTCTFDRDCAPGTVCGVGGTCIEDPGIASCIASPWTGAGWYVDGTMGNVRSLQPDPAATSAALSFGTTGSSEELYRAIWSVADPAASPGTETGCSTPMAGFLGCPGFRSEAVRILVVFTDEDSDGGETAAQPGTALTTGGITMIGVWSGLAGAAARTDLVDVANASGSLSGAGTPLVFDGADSAVVPVVVSAINEIVEGVPLRVTIEAADEPGDAGDAIQFIDRLETNTTATDCAVIATEDADTDGVTETYPAVTPGTRVCWDVVPEMNTTVMPETLPLIFRARLTVRGDGSPVDSRLVYFLVPPVPPTIEEPM
jgi:hypothetical protein